jgi:hypothetical protein
MEPKTAYKQFIIDAAIAQKSYPLLELNTSDIPELSGTIILKDDIGQELDRYQVLIRATEFYPYFFPNVFETGGRIPINVDWHVYESDGRLCLCTTTEEFIKTANGIALDEFVKNELEPYLFNQTYRRKEGFFLNEMPHGDAGQLASLKSLLKTNNIVEIRQFLHRAGANFTMGRTDFCFCKSGLKYRHCHRDILNTFKTLGEMKLSILLNLVEGSKEYRYSYY